MEWNGMSMVVGLGSGVMVGVYPSLLSDELGAEQLGRTYPVSLTLAGLINLAGPPALAQVLSRKKERKNIYFSQPQRTRYYKIYNEPKKIAYRTCTKKCTVIRFTDKTGSKGTAGIG